MFGFRMTPSSALRKTYVEDYVDAKWKRLAETIIKECIE